MQIKRIRRGLFLFRTLLAGILGTFLIAYCIGIGAQTEAGQSKVTDAATSRQEIIWDDPEWTESVPLGRLAAESDWIVVGFPFQNVGRLSPDGQRVTTEYRFRISEIIKGPGTVNSDIRVGVPGGIAKGWGGGILAVRTPRIRRMQHGKTYLLFLKSDEAGSVLSTLRGSQGIYEIPHNSSRIIHLGRSFTLPETDDGEDTATFLKEVRRLATRFNKTR